MKDWPEVERRKQATDHDTLIQVVQILNNHVKNFDNHIESFNSHIVNDENRFASHEKKLENHSRYIYMAMGGLAILQIFLGLHK